MRSLPYVPALLLLAATYTGAEAADPNGYTAQYECRAGGPHCNVDVAALGKRACDQIITPSMDWSSINWSNNTICLEAGDHTWKGLLAIPSSANGSSGNYKVLRYYRANDTDDDPWKQGSSQARVKQLRVAGSYWLIHRLTFPQNSSSYLRVESSGGARHQIFNRILVEGTGAGHVGKATYGYSQDCRNYSGYDSLTIQNSVFRNSGGQNSSEGIAVDMQCSSNLRAVNNEIYNWCSHPIQTGNNDHPTLAGLVIENNDMYVSSALHLSSGRAKTEDILQLKAKGTAQSPVRVIQNRLWGARQTDVSYCGNGTSGAGLALGEDMDYQLLQNNIIMESKLGIHFQHPNSNNNSIIGNLVYQMRNYDNGSTPSRGINSRVHSYGEVYLNTIIDANDLGLATWDDGNVDYKCNVLIASGKNDAAKAPSGSVADYNAFYGTPVFGFNGGNNNIVESLKTRANSTRYELGDVIRVGSASDCKSENDASCYLYKVVAPGVSASSAPSYCTSANCTTYDGSMTLVAIRGPYVFNRRLRTGPERYVIPYARPYAVASGGAESPREAYACPADFAGRAGLGINNDG
jgi:hypothetical protein